MAARLLGILLPALLCGCSVLEETWLAEDPFEGEEAREVHAEFEGSSALSDNVLRTVIRPDMMGLSRGLDAEAAAFDASDAIAARYRSVGYPDVEVDFAVDGPQQRPDAADLFVLRFTIREGPLVTVSEMTLEGNELFDDDTLLELWSRTNTGTFGTGDPQYVQADLEDFAQSIRVFYWRKGYWGVNVEGPAVERDPNTVTVRIRIAEGPRYRFGRVTVAPELTRALAEDLPPIPEGDVFTTRALQEFLMSMRNTLRNNGYPEPRVGIPPLGDLAAQEEPVVDIAVRGEPGPRVRYGDIEIEGLDRTRESFVRGKLRFEKGELFDGQEEEDSLAKLYRTGLFRSVRIEHEEPGEGVMPVTLHFEEVEARSIEFLAGYGSYEQARGGVRYEDRNLFGTGRIISLEGRISERGFRTATLFTEPSLFGSETEWSIGGELYRREQPSFTDKAFGGTTAFRRELPAGITGRLGYSYTQHTDADVQAMDPAAVLDDYDTGIVFAELRRERRDNFIAPTEGSFLFFRSDFADGALASDIDFWRLRFGGSFAFPLTEETVLVVRGESGWLFPRDDGLIPLPERFYNGGYDTVRSFDQFELGPQDAAGEPLGGEYRNVFNVELRQTIIGPLEATVFADAGNLGSSIEDYGLSDMRYALGPGLRLQLPIGPIRFDAGWNPDRQIGEEEWVLHLAIGYPF